MPSKNSVPSVSPPFVNRTPSFSQLKEYVANAPVDQDQRINCPCCTDKISIKAGFWNHFLRHGIKRPENGKLTFSASAKYSHSKRKQSPPIAHVIVHSPRQALEGELMGEAESSGETIKISAARLHELQAKERAYDTLRGDFRHCPRCGFAHGQLQDAMETTSDLQV
jgi:hypothetical protein